MAKIALWLKVEGGQVASALREAGETLDTAGGEVVLDLSSVHRVDPEALRAMDEFVEAAGDKGVKVALHGVSVDVYRVLKLAKLTPRFIFVG